MRGGGVLLPPRDAVAMYSVSVCCVFAFVGLGWRCGVSRRCHGLLSEQRLYLNDGIFCDVSRRDPSAGSTVWIACGSCSARSAAVAAMRDAGGATSVGESVLQR
jgi:hypothetical protein